MRAQHLRTPTAAMRAGRTRLGLTLDRGRPVVPALVVRIVARVLDGFRGRLNRRRKVSKVGKVALTSPGNTTRPRHITPGRIYPSEKLRVKTQTNGNLHHTADASTHYTTLSIADRKSTRLNSSHANI